MPCLTVENFCNAFGCSKIPIGYVSFIESADFSYEILNRDKRDDVFLECFRKLDYDKQKIGSKKRTQDWHSGWEENLESFRKSKNISDILPKFIRPGRVMRIHGEYAIPNDPNFEKNYIKTLQLCVFEKYLYPYEHLYEFGCGSGLNLVTLQEIFPEKNLIGTDFVQTSVDLINEISREFEYNMIGERFDMMHPDANFHIKPNSAILTFGSIEQLNSKFHNFVEYLIEQKPRICLHIEPTVELYGDDLFDYVATKFYKQRGYSEGFLPLLQELDKSNKIELLQVKRTGIGSLFMEGYNILAWKPL